MCYDINTFISLINYSFYTLCASSYIMGIGERNIFFEGVKTSP